MSFFMFNIPRSPDCRRHFSVIIWFAENKSSVKRHTDIVVIGTGRQVCVAHTLCKPKRKTRRPKGYVMPANNPSSHLDKNATIYIKAEQNVEIQSEDVYVKDIAKLNCSDPHVLAKAKAVKLCHFKEDGPQRQVISLLKVIEEIEKACPGVQIQSIGEPAVMVDHIRVDKHKGPVQTLKLVFVALVSFFGTSFTIMAFHNDIGINDVFSKIYEMVTGYQGDGYGILELSYSVGLAVGIIVFFNHIGGRRITKDPTPIEVEMRIYEEDVNKALIETADREGKTIDVD